MKNTLKRTLALLLTFAMLLTGVPLISTPVLAADANVIASSDDFTYEVLNGTYCSITKYTGSAKEVIIPSELDGYIVQQISDGAFKNNTTVEKVVFPETLETVKSNIFYGCTNLVYVGFGNNLKSISRYMFYNCKSLEEITLPSGLTSIDYYSFEDCTSLKSIVIPDSVTAISGDAFYNCTRLSSVTLPVSWNTVYVSSYSYYESPFRNCTNLTEITLPDGMTKVPDYAFRYCTSLNTVNFPETITKIGSYAFDGCTGFRMLNLNENLKTIGSNAFSNCDGLVSLVLNENLSTLSNYAFSYCENLTAARVPKTVTSFGADAFYGCSKLTIYCYSGSAAHLALENTSYKYFLLDDHEHEYEVTIETETTCTRGGSQIKKCTVCGYNYIELVDALGHDYSAVITAPTCTKNGYTTYTCSRCNDVYIDNYIDTLAHSFGDWQTEVKAGCESQGIKCRYCDVCGYKDTETIPALGHSFSSEWTVDKEANCITTGSKSHHCVYCSAKKDVTDIPMTGHSYSEFITLTEPTCTTAGLKQKTCTVCGDVVKDEIPALGHDFPEYTRTKEPTVLCEGEEQSTCTRCGHVDTIILPAIQIDIDSDTNYGLANFTVVNAQTKEPIKNAKIYIYTENDGENEFATDADGKVSVVLPVGKQQISAYANGCLTRNLNINVKSGTNDIPLIGLSDMKTYDAEVTQHLMTYDEIEEAGIDVEDPENNHVFKYELNLVFVPEVDWLSIMYCMDDFGNIIPGGSGGGSGGGFGGGFGSGWVSGGGYGKGTYYRHVDPEGGVKEIYPVSEYFYLIISGEVRWLKEMFDVEMLIINNSETDTLENLNATLNLPEGLSLAAMKGDEQSLSVDLDNIPEGGTSSVHWYVRGDTAGTYPIEAKLTGMVMPFEEEINDTFKAEKAIEVWAGNALHLDFEVPAAAYYGEDYNVKITLTNVSDITLYNVSSFVTNIKQSRVTHYSDGSVEEEIYMDQDVNIGDFAAEFKPGDKIVIELSINILFESKLMEYKLNKLISYVDGVEQLLKAFKAIKTALDIGTALIKGISKVSKAIDTFIESEALTTDKLTATKALKEAVVDYSLKYSKSENKTLDASVKLANSSVGVMFNAFTSDPDAWLEKSSVKDIQKLTSGIKTLGNSLSSTSSSSSKKFNVFDSIRTLISAIPVVFTLHHYFLVEDEDNTTSIPYTISVSANTPHYFGVSNLGRHLSNILRAALADYLEDNVPSYFYLIPGVEESVSADDAKREIAIVENEIAQFKAKSATGDVKYKVYIVRNEEQTKAKMLRAAANTATNGFELSSDAEDAVIENGVLTFTGDAIINVKPLSTQNGTLVVEADDGTKYEYDLNVVEQHECDEDDYEVIISPTADYDGFAVKCCSVCEDVMDVVILTSTDCEHTFGVWTTEIAATCKECGLRSHSCSKCGFEESEILDADSNAHVVSDWVIDTDSTCSAVGSKHTYCTACGEIIETQEIAKKAHTISAWVIDTDSTCSAVGSKHTYCTVCNETIETQEIAKKAHTVSDWVIDVDSTCSAVGSKHTYCTACGVTIETQEIAKKEHSVSDWIVTKAPSCTSFGKQIKKCTICNTEIESKAIAATGHTMTAWSETKAPTCTENGVRTRTCTVCKKTETASISATGHIDTDNDGTCNNCFADLGTKDPSSSCSHMCHKTKGISKFFWKIFNFFNKLFKIKQYCDCGAKHW